MIQGRKRQIKERLSKPTSRPGARALTVSSIGQLLNRGSATRNKEKPPLKGTQIRETTGFDRPFSAHTAQKNPEIRQVFPDFSILSGRKISRSKLLRTQKDRFLCRARRKAQEYWLCIPSIFNEVRREKILFALDVSLFCAP